jgi:dCMP deaminase
MRTHKQWFDRLKVVATNSHDPDTQLGCTIVSPLGGFVDGSNRIPTSLKVTPERVNRPAKYSHIQHSEPNAICNAAKYGVRTMHATMYLNWFPCSECASDIVQAGISDLHVDKAAYEARKDDPRYGFALAMEKLVEAGVRIVWHL